MKKITKYVSLMLAIILAVGCFNISFAESDIQERMDAYYEKGVLLQYQDEGLESTSLSLIDLSSDEVQYTVCSDFVYDFYYNEYGITDLEHFTKLLAKSKYGYRSIPCDEWSSYVENGTWYEELVKDLEVGDLINIVNHDTQLGHVMMVYSLGERPVLIHSTGSRTEWEERESLFEPGFIEGTIRKDYLEEYIGKRWVNNKSWDIMLIRVLGNNSKAPSEERVEEPGEEAVEEPEAFKTPVKEKSELQKLADKYYEKGVLLQYLDKGKSKFPTIDLNREEAQYTDCAHFTYSFYLNEFGIELGKSVTATNAHENSNIIKMIPYEDWKEMASNGSWKSEILSDLKEGDLISVRHPDLDQKIGHIMMVYEVLEDDAVLIHSTGSSSKEDAFTSEIEEGFTEGTVRKQYLSTVFTGNYLNAERDVRIMRPLEKPAPITRDVEPENEPIQEYHAAKPKTPRDSKKSGGEPENNFSITYILGIDGSVISEEMSSRIIEGIEPPEVDGYEFTGWTADKVVYMTVSGGSFGEETAKSYMTDSEVPAKEVIQSIIHNFEGDREVAWNEDYVWVTEDTTFTANYRKLEEPEFKASYVSGIDGSLISEEMTTGTIEGIDSPEVEGYEFIGWTVDKLVYMDIAGGSVHEEGAKSFISREEITSEDTINDIKFFFSGDYNAAWNERHICIEEDTVFTANYKKLEETKPSFKVTYVSGIDGSLISEEETEGIIQGIDAPKVEGYEFIGWTVDKTVHMTQTGLNAGEGHPMSAISLNEITPENTIEDIKYFFIGDREASWSERYFGILEDTVFTANYKKLEKGEDVIEGPKDTDGNGSENESHPEEQEINKDAEDSKEPEESKESKEPKETSKEKADKDSSKTTQEETNSRPNTGDSNDLRLEIALILMAFIGLCFVTRECLKN